MDPLISINTDGLAKCLDIIAHCTGWHANGIKKDADANYYADELSIKSANNIKLLQEQGSEDLANYVLMRESRKAQNVANIANKVVSHFSPNEKVSNEPISQDWLNRYFEYAESISEEEMQNLWARILAGEIKQPRSFSKRTLEIVRNLSSEEAKLIVKYVGRIVDYGIPSIANIDPLELQKLDEIGFINSNALSIEKRGATNENNLLGSNKSYCLIAKAKKECNISYYFKPLTDAGKEIAKIVIDQSVDSIFFMEFAKELCSKYPVTISMHQIVEHHENGCSFKSKAEWVIGE